ncbi:hypothetical protein [Haloprofundus halobius]|uniref:hypothetical protein n=1 Tax=Haloprofundus halobius TaxID=2876194 RepID=UPI001CCE291F|nr:hypothetical protein [Haloprofundus halobius]
MRGSSDWPLPSQSQRVRLLLYFSEGLIIGAGLSLCLVRVFGPFLIDVEFGSFNPTLSAVGASFLLLILFFALRGVGFYELGRRYSRNHSPEYQDWTETRRWIWVATVAFPLGGVLLGVSVLLWGWWAVVFLQLADLLMLGTTFIGFILYIFTLQRVGAELL